MTVLEQRIVVLEQANRRLRYVVGLPALVLFVALILAAGKPADVGEVLRARRIEIVAPNGKSVIELSADDQMARLTLRGPDGERGIALGADGEAVVLALMKNKEAPLLSARVDDCGATLGLYDGRQPSQHPQNIILASTYLIEKQKGSTMICLDQGPQERDVRAGLFVDDPAGSSYLMLGDKQGRKVKARVGKKSGEVEFIDENNKVIRTGP